MSLDSKLRARGLPPGALRRPHHIKFTYRVRLSWLDRLKIFLGSPLTFAIGVACPNDPGQDTETLTCATFANDLTDAERQTFDQALLRLSIDLKPQTSVKL